MGLLKSVDDIEGIDYYEYRDCDYYNKYVYRARFYLPGARYAHGHKSVGNFIAGLAKIKFFEHSTIQKQIHENLPVLKKFLEWQLKHSKNKNFSTRIEGGTVGIYSNDLKFLHDIKNDIPEVLIDYTESKKSEYRGTKQFVKEPKHKYRVYLKSRRIEAEFATDLLNSIMNSSKLHPSAALQFWLNNAVIRKANWKYRWTSASHFIDYDDESTLSYLALKHGDLLGKQYKLEKRPD